MSSEKPIASKIIQEMAAIAWKSGIRGKGLKRSPLMMPINKIFDQIRKQQLLLDLETLRAATITEIFSYLERIHDPKKPQFNKCSKKIFSKEKKGKFYRN